MDESEYARRYRKQGIIIGAEVASEEVESQSITIDGQTVVPLHLKILNSTPQERYERDSQRLRENVEVVGRIQGGVELIRRTGGAYDHNEQWRNFMRRCGRLK